MKTRLRIQYVLCYSLMITAAVFFVYVLGFMTDFFIFFMDGDDAVYQFFKDLQILNNELFYTALTALVMALFLKGFDITGKRAGLFGLLYVLALAVVNFINGSRIVTFNNYFLNAYQSLDFTSLDAYSPSVLPFRVVFILYALIVILTICLLAMTGWNFLKGRKRGDSDD